MTDPPRPDMLDAAERPSSLRLEAARTTSWSAVQQLASAVLSSLTFFALGRLLAPSSIGLVAAAGVWVGLFGLFVDVGLDAALIQRPTVTKSHKDAVFAVSFVCGTAGFAVLFAVAPLISSVNDMPQLVPVLRVLGLLLVIAPFGSVPRAVLSRELRFRALTLRSLVAVAIGGATGIGLAIAGAGVWSLVGQQLAGTAVGVSLLLRGSDWSPRFRLRMREARDVIPFGIKVLGGEAMVFAERNVDYLLLGLVASDRELGLYALAFRLVYLLHTAVVSSVVRSFLPLFSRVESSTRLARVLRQTLSTVMVLAAPVFVGLALSARDLVPMLFGERWAPSAPMVSWLALSALLQVSTHIDVAALQATGKPGLGTRLLAIQTLGTVVAVALSSGGGGRAVAVALFVRSLLLLPIAAIVVVRGLAVPLFPYLRSVLRPCAVAAGAGATALAASTLVPTGGVSRLAVELGVLSTTYVVGAALVERASAAELLRLGRTLLAGARGG